MKNIARQYMNFLFFENCTSITPRNFGAFEQRAICIIVDAQTGSHAPGLSWHYAPLDGVFVAQYYVVGEKRGRDNHNTVHDALYVF